MKDVRVVKETFLVPEGCMGSGTAPSRRQHLSCDSKKAPSVKNRAAERALSHGHPVGTNKVGQKPFLSQATADFNHKGENSL